MKEKEIIENQQKVVDKLQDASSGVTKHLGKMNRAHVDLSREIHKYNKLLTSLVRRLNTLKSQQRNVMIKNEKAVEGIGRFLEHDDLKKDIGADGRKMANECMVSYKQAVSHDVVGIIEDTFIRLQKINKMISKDKLIEEVEI